MKLTEQKLKEIIKEEIQRLNETETGQETFGTKFVSSGQRAKGLQQKKADVLKKSGVDSKEHGMITQIEDVITELADVDDIKIGQVRTILNTTYKKLVVLLQQAKAEQKGN
jgi:hypothetical protein